MQRARSRGRPNCWGGSNSRIAIARSAGFSKGGTSRIAIVRSAGSRSRDRPDSKGGQFPNRDRAIGQIPAEGTSRIAIPRWVGFRGGGSSRLRIKGTPAKMGAPPKSRGSFSYKGTHSDYANMREAMAGACCIKRTPAKTGVPPKSFFFLFSQRDTPWRCQYVGSHD